jgi:hypothetical protein
MSNWFSEDGVATRVPVAPAGQGVIRDPAGSGALVAANHQGVLALPVQVMVGRFLVAAAQPAATYSVGESGAGSILGALASHGLIYIDPAKFPALLGLTAKLRVALAVITNSVAPGVTFTGSLKPVLTWNNSANPGPATTDTDLGAAAVATPAAAGATRTEGAPFAVPAAGWYVLAMATSGGTTAASSSSHTVTRLERLYS